MSTTSIDDVRPAVSVDELKRAWHALQDGAFRPGHGPRRQVTEATGEASEWIPAAGERTIAVIGSAGSAGATTVALAISVAAATNAARDVDGLAGSSRRAPVRVIECCSVTASGLAAASTAELGVHTTGWRQGTRDRVLLERASEPILTAADVPTPTPIETGQGTGPQLTVLDIGWDLTQLRTTNSWVNDAVWSADAILVVATASVPGLRRLEGVLELIHGVSGTERTAVAVVGPRRKRWAKGVEHSAGPFTRRAIDTGRIVEIPEDRTLATAGLDSRPLPPPLLQAATTALTLLDATSGDHHDPTVATEVTDLDDLPDHEHDDQAAEQPEDQFEAQFDPADQLDGLEDEYGDDAQIHDRSTYGSVAYDPTEADEDEYLPGLAP